MQQLSLTRPSPSTEQQSSQKLHPIYQALDAHNYTKALKLTSSSSSSNDHHNDDITNQWDIVRALRVHALERCGKTREALVLLWEILVTNVVLSIDDAVDDEEEGSTMMSSSSTYSPLNNNHDDTPFLFGGGGVQNQQSYNNSSTTTTNNNNLNNNAETSNSKKKATRINWSKSPHKQRLHQIINDWYTSSGNAIDTQTNEPITDYKVYAAKVGIPKTTLFRYIHKDPSKRRLLTMNNTNDTNDNSVVVNNNEDGIEGGVEESNEGGIGQHTQLLLGCAGSNNNDGQRGRKRLIDDMGIKFIVGQLKAKTSV